MATKWNKLSKSQQAEARRLWDRAVHAGLEVTVSRIGGDLDHWAAEITAAERAKAAAEAAAAQATEEKEATPAEPAQLIAALRSAGRTARQIAAHVGVHVSTIYRWARGAFRPATHRIAALAAMAAA